MAVSLRFAFSYQLFLALWTCTYVWSISETVRFISGMIRPTEQVTVVFPLLTVLWLIEHMWVHFWLIFWILDLLEGLTQSPSLYLHPPTPYNAWLRNLTNLTSYSCQLYLSSLHGGICVVTCDRYIFVYWRQKNTININIYYIDIIIEYSIIYILHA